ncbi:MAG: TPR domain protein, putative component of TonB system [Ignavibacteriae bacterium]|nr:MAG: TPR domain protein, putative component of TonB system [Ignavibacteriota bacterium]
MKKNIVFSFLLLIVLLNAVIYLQTLHYGFVNYDDDKMVYENSNFLRSLDNIPKAFSVSVFEMHNLKTNFYRPILLTSYIVDYQIWGLKPFGYHLTNLFLHILNAIGVFYLLNLLLNESKISFIGSIIFSLHPIQTQAVAWIAGRNDVLLGLFTILMFLSYLIYTKTKLKKYYVFSLISFLFALFTKEQALFLFFIYPLYDLFFYIYSRTSYSIKNKIIHYSVPLALILIYLQIRVIVFGSYFGQGNYIVNPFTDRLIQFPSVLGAYIKLILIPINLNLVHIESGITNYIFGFSFLALILWIFISIREKLPIMTFGLFWLFLFIIPSANLFPLPVAVLEHRMYTPLIGFSIFITSVLYFYYQKYRKYVFIISSMMIIVYATITYLRLPVWKSSETLWLDVIKKNPQHDLAYYNLGTYYLQNDRLNDAILYLKFAESKNPGKRDILINLAYALLKNKDYEQAINVYEKLLKLDPYNEQAYIGLGNAFRFLRRDTEAKEVYLNGISKLPNSEKLHYELGLCYGSLKDHQSAEYELKKAIELNKHYGMAYFSLGGLYSHTGKDSLAIKYLEEGLKYDKPTLGVYYIMSNSYLNIGDTLKAGYYRNLYEKLKQF